MKRHFLLLACLSTPASASVDQAALDSVSFAPRAGAHLPLDLPLRANGRPSTLRAELADKPALLLPVDFNCRVTCGPALSIVSESLTRIALKPSTDYRLLLLGLNTKIEVGDTLAFVEDRVRSPEVRSATVRLVATPSVLDEFTRALGYEYRFDPSTQSFAHPLGAVSLTKGGAVTRLLSPLALDPNELRLALVEAGEGKIGNWTTRLALLCYGFDAAHGVYTSRVVLILQAAALVFVLSLLIWIAWLMLRGRGDAGAMS